MATFFHSIFNTSHKPAVSCQHTTSQKRSTGFIAREEDWGNNLKCSPNTKRNETKQEKLNGLNVLHVVVRDRMFRTLPPPVVYLWATCSLSLGLPQQHNFCNVFLLLPICCSPRCLSVKYRHYWLKKWYYYERLKTWHRTTDVKNNEQISWAIQKFKTTGKALKHLLARQHRKQKGLRQHLKNKDQKSLSLPFSNFSVP